MLHPTSSPRRAFTLIELLVVIAIIAIIAAILFPVFAQAREKGRQAVCLSNLKQLGTAVMLYTQNYDETYPCAGYTRVIGEQRQAVGPPEMLFSYVKNRGVYTCPSDPEPLDVQRMVEQT